MKISNRKQKTDKKRKTAFRAALLLLLVLSLIFYRDSLGNIMEGIRQVTWKELSISVLLALSGYLLEGITVSCMMETVVPRIHTHGSARGYKRSGIFIAFVCEFYRLTTLGNGSGIAEIHYLTKKNIETGKATTLTMIQYVIKRTAIMLFGVFGFLFLFFGENAGNLCRDYLPFMGAGCLITALVIALFLCITLSPGLAAAALYLLDRLRLKIPSGEETFHKWGEQITLLNRSGKEILLKKRKRPAFYVCKAQSLCCFTVFRPAFFSGKRH